MRKKIAFLVLAFAVSAPSLVAQTRTVRTTLDIYVVDVEGGNAVLFVPPSGESVLVDTGNVPPGAVRDAERIMAALKDAGVTQIDHLIITHWHGDHFGGLAELSARIPIKQFIDHGPNVQPGPAADEFLQKTYPALESILFRVQAGREQCRRPAIRRQLHYLREISDDSFG
jgi:glyoxylase-like metal-dependent hydrolase (beta-lactamase superfamily II)